MRAGFILSEVGIGLRRNLTMTFAVVITVAISLSLLGIGLLSNAQVRVMKDYWYDKISFGLSLWIAFRLPVMLCWGSNTGATP